MAEVLLKNTGGFAYFWKGYSYALSNGNFKSYMSIFLTRLNVLLASKNFQIFLLISAVEQIVSFDRVGMTDPHQGFCRPDIAGQTRGDKYLLSLFTTFISPLSVLPT